MQEHRNFPTVIWETRHVGQASPCSLGTFQKKTLPEVTFLGGDVISHAYCIISSPREASMWRYIPPSHAPLRIPSERGMDNEALYTVSKTFMA
jgi:hypothetical protein